MIIDYDHNPALTDEEKLRSLVDNLILAFNEVTDLMDKQQKLIDAVIRGSGSEYDEDIAEIRSDITAMQSNISAVQGNINTINGNISTMQGNISALQDVADEAILQGAAS